MRKLIFKCHLALGDVVLLTAAVRELHRAYPGHFQTDTRTPWPELWHHNPHLTCLHEYDPEARILECQDALIARSRESACHVLHGFLEFLNITFGFRLKPTEFRGDIHLSTVERRTAPVPHVLGGGKLPYWLVSAGGKTDLTTKWWDPARYQEVVDRFQGRIQFVQVGAAADCHPSLRGVIDLRGRTNIRQLIHLVHHAQGVLCGVTGLMHLAAAVPVYGPERLRPCVVTAGGREPAHWEAYPGHQYIDRVGTLACCALDGCWRSRTVPLGDGDQKDRPEELCTNVSGSLPRCMDLITADEVCQRIESYFAGGAAAYLHQHQQARAARAVLAAGALPKMDLPLNVVTARSEADKAIAAIPEWTGGAHGRGIVICAGGVRLFVNAWVCVRMLRHLRCPLPVQVWYLGPTEMDDKMRSLLAPWGVEFVDAEMVRRKNPVRLLGGWGLKAYALLHTCFSQALLLDADNVPVRNPEYLFDTAEFRRTGAVLWPDFEPLTQLGWALFGVPYREEPSVESGQILVDRERCWRALSLAMWYNEHSDFYYQYVHGDKETFHMAFRKLGQPYAMPAKSIKALRHTMVQHDFQGRPVFQHRNMDKWTLLPINQRVRGFLHEARCRRFLTELREKWDGRAGAYLKTCAASHTGKATIAAVMISAQERVQLRQQTLEAFSRTDWGEPLASICLDERRFRRKIENVMHTSWRALHAGLSTGADYILHLEDDVRFNRHLRQNLDAWTLLHEKRPAIATIYNPGTSELAWDLPGRAVQLNPERFFGAQAVLIRRDAAEEVIARWFEGPPGLDLKLGWIALMKGQPIYAHFPSLVQHVGRKSVWGGHFHRAKDFSGAWRGRG